MVHIHWLYITQITPHISRWHCFVLCNFPWKRTSPALCLHTFNEITIRKILCIGIAIDNIFILFINSLNIFVFIFFIFQFRDDNNAYLSSFSIFFLNRIVWSFSAGFMSFGHPPKDEFVDRNFFLGLAYLLLCANKFCHHVPSSKIFCNPVPFA